MKRQTRVRTEHLFQANPSKEWWVMKDFAGTTERTIPPIEALGDNDLVNSQGCRVGAPITEFGNVFIAAFGDGARKQDAIDDAAVRQFDRTAVEVGRFAGLDACAHLIAHAVDLACDRNAAGLDLEHAGMDIIDGVEPVNWRRTDGADELGTIQIMMQRKPAHQRAVYEQIHGHNLQSAFVAGSVLCKRSAVW